MLKIPQSIHQSLAALSKVIRGSQLLTPEVQKLASALLNQEVIKRTHNIGTVNLLTLLSLFTLLTVLNVFLDFLLAQFLFISVEFQLY